MSPTIMFILAGLDPYGLSKAQVKAALEFALEILDQSPQDWDCVAQAITEIVVRYCRVYPDVVLPLNDAIMAHSYYIAEGVRLDGGYFA